MIERKRCKWCNFKNPIYIKYHDEEWGVPNFDEHYLFEMLILESFQAGLSWECVLNKREAFRKAFEGFSAEKIATYDDDKITELQNNKDIIRNKLKIRAAVRNLEDELVHCADITKITDLTHSKSNSNFKSDFCKMSNRRVALTKHQLDVLKLWTTNPPEPFIFVSHNFNVTKK